VKDFLKRIASPVSIPALLAVIYFVVKTWIGFEIPEWDKFVVLLMAALTAFGIVNDPTNKAGF
jgi:uncharacterized membrane protein